MTTPTPITRHDGTVARPENPERHGFSRADFTGGESSSGSSGSVYPSAAQRLSGEIRPIDLRDYDGPLFVINKTKDMISHDDGKGNVLRVEPVYNRDHVAPLPIEVAKNVGFQRLWRSGRIQVTTDPAMEDYLTLANSPAEDLGGILPYTLDAGQNKDLSPRECAICQEQIFMSKEDLDNGLPELCDLHIDHPELVEQVRDAAGNLKWVPKEVVVKASLVNTTIAKGSQL